MSQPGKWWIGLLPLAIVWIAANWFKTEAVERDIATRVGATVERSAGAVEPPKIAVSGRDITVSGVVLDQAARERLADAILAEAGSRLVNATAISLPPVARPYTFAAKRLGNDIVLTGSVPSPSVRMAIVNTAQAGAGAGKVIDQLTIAQGAPDGFQAMALHGEGLAARLEGGEFSLSDAAYSLKGAAPDLAGQVAIDRALKQLPDGARLAQADIVPPVVKPYVWSASSDGRTITLGGVVPDAAAKASVLAAAAKAFPASVDDGTQIARGAPQGDFEKLTSFALNVLAQLVSGKAILSDQTLSIEGIGQREVTVETIARDAKARLPSGFNLIVDGVVPSPVKPFTLRMEKTAGEISAVGFAPTIPARNGVIAAVRNFNLPTVADVKLASGLPAGVDYTAAINYALTQLAAMKTGVAVFTDGELSIPAGVKLGVLDIKSAPVPQPPESAPEVLPPALPPVAEMPALPPVVAPTAPEPVAPAVRAPDERPASAVQSSATSPVTAPAAQAPVAPEVVPPARTTPVEQQAAPVSCAPQAGASIAEATAHFDSASRRLKPNERVVLDAIVAAAKQCSTARIVIAGHTDSEGSRFSNIRLSSQRAFAASNYLIAHGVARARITTLGYGEDRRLVEHDATSEDRAKNRRVVVQIK
jgi:OOP family OmpA-OmpF porin